MSWLSAFTMGADFMEFCQCINHVVDNGVFVLCVQALNPVLILVMIPLFDQIIYPFLEYHRYSLRAVPRMVIGMILSAIAFLFSGLLQVAVDNRAASGDPLSILWQIPQYVVITAGEIMFSITGLEFAYSQAPDSMKAVVQSAWLFTVSAGKLSESF